jgi:phage tail sheath protein FI
MAETIISPGVLTRENDISFIQPAPVQAGAAFIGPTVKGPDNQPTIVTSYNDFTRKFGETFTSGSSNYEFLTSVAVKNYFSQGGGTALITRVVSGAYDSGTSTFISASAKGSEQPFTLKTLGKGALFNNAAGQLSPYLTGSASASYINPDGSLVSGSADNVRWEIQNVNSQLGTFTLLVRQGDDNTNNPIVLETFTNLNLDPASDNYIEKVIGNQFMTVGTDSSTGVSYNYLQGTYPNRSNYVRVSAVGLTTPNYLRNDGVTVSIDSTGTSYSASLPITSSGAFYNATGVVKSGANYFANLGTGGTGADAQGLVGDNYTTAISLLSNKDDYQFNIITTPGLIYGTTAQGSGTRNAKNVIDSIISLAESRGDCIAVVDLVPTGSALTAVTTQAATINSSYAATYWPWVQIQSATGQNQYVPAGTVIPGVYAFTDNSSAPWFAPAGLVRGGLAGVIQAERKLTKGDRDTLYLGKVNPIATFPGTGISVFGQKTLQTKASALDRVNVRRLLIELKKFIGDQARNLVFEQNTVATRNRFLAIVNPYLESVVQRQGLYAYRVVMDDTNNTADVVDRNQLVGQIYIQPTKTIEFVVLDFVIEPTGATFA